MIITVEIPDEHLSYTSAEELEKLMAVELDRILVRQRFGDDLADSGVTMAEIRKAKKAAWEQFGKEYVKDLVIP